MRLDQIGLTLGDLDLGTIDAEGDARLGDYFVTTPYVQSVYLGRRTLFLGRKGSGKSAVFTQLERILSDRGLQDRVEVVKITPDQYAWSALKSYREQGILPEQAHSNAWKLTLAIEIAGRLSSSERQWSKETKGRVEILKSFLTSNFGELRPELVKSATAILRNLRSLNLSAFGFGLGVDVASPDDIPITPAVISALYEVIGSIAQEQPILIGLDRLDDSWDGSPESQSLMIGLLKASKDINDEFGTPMLSARGVRVITFLRSDIYDSLRFDDKDKHRATEQNILWTMTELSEMLQRRLPAEVTVDELFSDGAMRG
jgi:energy-coupling factor transporter ATP-binding protein EcfA2